MWGRAESRAEVPPKTDGLDGPMASDRTPTRWMKLMPILPSFGFLNIRTRSGPPPDIMKNYISKSATTTHCMPWIY